MGGSGHRVDFRAGIGYSDPSIKRGRILHEKTNTGFGAVDAGGVEWDGEGGGYN